MPDDSNGIYNVPAGTLVNTGDIVLPSQHNPWANDSASAISNRFSKDGRAPATGDWNLNSFRISNLANPIANGDAVNKTYADGVNTNVSASTRGYIFGLFFANNAIDPTNDIDIAPGAAASDATVPSTMTLSTGILKRLDAAWAVGSGNGGLDTGTIANTTYHVWLIQRSDTGVVDALFSTSATSPTMPSGYDRKRRIGAILREAGVIVPFAQTTRNRFERKLAVIERSSTTALASTLFALSVPSGIPVRPILYCNFSASSATSYNIANLIGSPAVSTSADVTFQQLIGATGQDGINRAVLDGAFQTNSSRQVYLSVVIGSGTIVSNILTSRGWYDDSI